MLVETFQYLSAGFKKSHLNKISGLALSTFGLSFDPDFAYINISYRASIATTISMVSSWIIIYILCHLYLHQKVKCLYFFARVGETFLPLGSNILLLPATRMLLTSFYCFEGESDEKLNLHLNCDIPCWKEEHKAYFSACTAAFIIYIIIAAYCSMSHN